MREMYVNVLQRVAACCSVLQCAVVRCSVLQSATRVEWLQHFAVYVYTGTGQVKFAGGCMQEKQEK